MVVGRPLTITSFSFIRDRFHIFFGAVKQQESSLYVWVHVYRKLRSAQTNLCIVSNLLVKQLRKKCKRKISRSATKPQTLVTHTTFFSLHFRSSSVRWKRRCLSEVSHWSGQTKTNCNDSKKNVYLQSANRKVHHRRITIERWWIKVQSNIEGSTLITKNSVAITWNEIKQVRNSQRGHESSRHFVPTARMSLWHYNRLHQSYFNRNLHFDGAPVAVCSGYFELVLVLFNLFLFSFLRCRLNANSIHNVTRRWSVKLIFVFRFVPPFTFLYHSLYVFFFLSWHIVSSYITSSLFVRLLRSIFRSHGYYYVFVASFAILIIFWLDFCFICLLHRVACEQRRSHFLSPFAAYDSNFSVIPHQIGDGGPMWNVLNAHIDMATTISFHLNDANAERFR